MRSPLLRTFAAPLAAALALVAWWRPFGVTADAQQPVVEATVADVARASAILRAVTGGLGYVPGEVIVKFKAGTDASAMAAVFDLATPRDTSAPRVRWVGDLAVVPTGDDDAVDATAARLQREPEVEYAQPNYLLRLHATPNDPGLSRQWNFTAIDVPRAWDINPGARDVTVAVIDTGVTSSTSNWNYRLWTGSGFQIATIPYRINPDIDAARITDAVDFTGTRLNYPGVATQPVFDTQGHGTHVAGTVMQATGNGLGYAGIAYNARLMALKACFSYWDLQLAQSALGQPGFIPQNFNNACDTVAAVQAVRYAADRGAKVINLSLGGSGEAPAYRDALNYAVQRGAFVAIAAGNEFEDGNPTSYPAAYAPQIAGVMTVGAVGPSLRRASYSNTGTYVEVAAPGGDVRAGGVAGLIYQTGLFGPDFDPRLVVPRFDRYSDDAKQGTSMASPHVAGIAALLVSQGFSSPAAIEAAIKKFARDLGAAGHDPEYGAGLIDARATLRGLGVAR
jgi:serine protease